MKKDLLLKIKPVYRPCPKCESSDGYIFQLVVHYIQHVDICDNSLSAQDTYSVGKEPTLYTCVNCKKRFRQKTIKLELE